MLRIGQIAKESGVGVETVRFYESEGLIEVAKRSASGYRQFPVTTIGQIRFIQSAKRLGFSLKEIGELMVLKDMPDSDCTEVNQFARSKIADIQRKIDSLEAIKTTLQPLIDRYQAKDSIGDCPILNAMGDDSANLEPSRRYHHGKISKS